MNQKFVRAFVLAAGIAIVASALLALATRPVKASWPKQRFERLLREENENRESEIRAFEVWHDQESGQEFTCAFPTSTLGSREKITCWPTGRNWKK